MSGEPKAVKKIKICGLKRPEDIDYVNRLNPDYIGFIINFPSSHRSLSPLEVAALKSKLSKDITPVGVFVDEKVQVVAELLNSGIIETAQLHGKEDADYIRALRKLTEKTIWQAFQIKSEEDVNRANESPADFVILDAGQGSGKAFNWVLLEKIGRPFGLAGGLNIDNLPEALKTKAALLDVSGGVETEKKKDFEKMKTFLEAARRFVS